MESMNIRIARELNRIAKDLIAVVPHGGHSSKFTTDSTDPYLIQEIQNTLDNFRKRRETYNQIRKMAADGANDMHNLYAQVYEQSRQSGKEFLQMVQTEPALRMIKEARETLIKVGVLAAKHGATLQATIAGITMTVEKSERGSDFTSKFIQGARKANMVEKEIEEYQRLARKYVTELSSHIFKEIYERRSWFLYEADALRDEINNAIKVENAHRKQRGEKPIPWNPIKWQDGMKMLKEHCKSYRTSGVKDWFRTLYNAGKKFFDSIVNGCKELISKLTSLISNGEKLDKKLQDLNRYFG